MDQTSSIQTCTMKKNGTTLLGKLGDRAVAKGALTMHQAALTITVFGHRIDNENTDHGEFHQTTNLEGANRRLDQDARSSRR